MNSIQSINKLIFIMSVVFAPFFVGAIDYSLPPVDVSVSAIVDEDIITPGGGGGGGGFPTGVIFSGYAYPGASVTIRKVAGLSGQTMQRSTAWTMKTPPTRRSAR
jgi:hypothetical protein